MLITITSDWLELVGTEPGVESRTLTFGLPVSKTKRTGEKLPASGAPEGGRMELCPVPPCGDQPGGRRRLVSRSGPLRGARQQPWGSVAWPVGGWPCWLFRIKYPSAHMHPVQFTRSFRLHGLHGGLEHPCETRQKSPVFRWGD